MSTFLYFTTCPRCKRVYEQEINQCSDVGCHFQSLDGCDLFEFRHNEGYMVVDTKKHHSSYHMSMTFGSTAKIQIIDYEFGVDTKTADIEKILLLV